MKYILENWSLTDKPSDPSVIYLQGNVYGNPRFSDGFYIHTTRIVAYKDGVFTTKSGSQYTLGEVDKEYEKTYPNATERVYTSAQEAFKNE